MQMKKIKIESDSESESEDQNQINKNALKNKSTLLNKNLNKSDLQSDIQEFNAFVEIIDFTTSFVYYLNTQYIILVKVEDQQLTDQESKKVSIWITDGIDKIWFEEYNNLEFKKYQSSCNIEGSYEDFFHIFKKSIENPKNLEIKEFKPELKLQITLQLQNSSVLIKSHLNLGEPLDRKESLKEDPNTFSEFIKTILFDVFKAQNKQKIDNQIDLQKANDKIQQQEQQIKEIQKNNEFLAQNIQQADQLFNKRDENDYNQVNNTIAQQNKRPIKIHYNKIMQNKRKVVKGAKLAN